MNEKAPAGDPNDPSTWQLVREGEEKTDGEKDGTTHFTDPNVAHNPWDDAGYQNGSKRNADQG